DVRDSGFCYGWTAPVLCVAGIIRGVSEEAEIALAELHSSAQWSALTDSCGGDPVILGKCVFERGKRHPALELAGIREYSIIYYCRHSAASLRFYSLETLEASAEQHDFTRRPPRTGVDDVVINQFNSAQTIDTVVQRKPLRHLELSQYLFDIMNVSLCVPQRVLSFAPPQHDLTAVSIFSARYTNFFNTVWLILNDITLGVACGSFLCENHVVLARMLNRLAEVFLIDWVRSALHWLDSWPAGFKLNTELSRVYAHTFSDLVAVWGYVLHRAAPYLPALLYPFGVLSAAGGMTTALALFSDLLALLTLHVYVCYVLAQLLFGTILFTLLTFLFPTVLAYYALFALTQLAFMNHFPLFALMLRAKDPRRLPGASYSGSRARSAYLLLGRWHILCGRVGCGVGWRAIITRCSCCGVCCAGEA
ncbi:N-acetylglucosaminyl transferase component-domain-containing protein, partial [Mycena rosella]